MARLRISVQAETDAAAIVAILHEQAGAQVAIRYRLEFETLFERLIMFPRSGVRRPSLGRHTRIGVVSPYVVLYEFGANDEATILRIVDGRRRITRNLVQE